MINSAQNQTISNLLNVDSNWRYVVPRYQREYVWRRDNWAALFDDVLENPPGHFLGSMICINRTKDVLAVQELEVVDGQQRLTTLSLLYAAILKSLLSIEDSDDATKYETFNLRRRLVIRQPQTLLRVEPSYQGNNFDDYRAILADTDTLDAVKIPANAGNRRLFKAYRFFIDRLDGLDERGDKLFDQTKVLAFLQKLNRASLVKIEVQSHADAFTLFESLNNRGIPLTALDLIKNNLLAALESKEPGSIDEHFDRWTNLLENLTDDYATQERFLRQYYNAFKHHPEVEVASIPIATRSSIIKIYDALVSRNAAWVFNDLSAKAKHFNDLMALTGAPFGQPATSQLVNLDRIRGVPAYTLLLYLVAERKAEQLAEVVKLLIKYFVRRNVTDVPPTHALDRLFIETIAALRQKPEIPPLEVIHQELVVNGRVADEALFRNRLAGNIYADNVGATRFILCSLEAEHRQTREMADLWQRNDNGDFLFTIEHVLPQGPNLPSAWIDMVANGDKTRANEVREQQVHRLGNLTLSGFNSKLGAKSFVEKRDRRDNKERFVGYRNGLWLNDDLSKRHRWGAEEIESRTQFLVDEVMRLFAW